MFGRARLATRLAAGLRAAEKPTDAPGCGRAPPRLLSFLVKSRLLCAALFLIAGALHFVVPGLYRAIVPAWLPRPDLLVMVSGAAELAGGAGLLVPSPKWRRAAGWGLLLLLVAVFPANVEMLRLGRARGVSGWAETLLWLRLPLQPALMVWVWCVSRSNR